MPKIYEMLLKLEGFQYALSLNLNMGYCHMQLSENKIHLKMLVQESTNRSYKLTRHFPTENE